MRKITYLATAALMGATIMATPMQAMAARPLLGVGTNRTNITSIFSGCDVITGNSNFLKDYLGNCQWGNVQIITIPCLPGNQPETEEPGAEDNNQPNKPDVEDDNQTNKPDVEDDNQSNQPGVEDNNQTNKPDVEDNNQTGQPGVEDNNQTNKPDVEDNNQSNKPGVEDDNQSNKPGTEDSEQSMHAYVLRVVELVNEERAKAGLNPLTIKEDVTEAAQVRAVECTTMFSHTRPNGTSFVTALKEAGVNYRGAGENIAWGQKTPEQVMEAWMNSSGHRANILNEKYTSIGVGYYQNASGVNYWSQLFTY